jgi:hypothetical protein
LRRIATALAILVVAGACTFGEILADYGDPVHLQPTDLVGTWISGQRSRAVTFDEDGTFTATDLPAGEFESFLPEGIHPGRIDGQGSWSIEQPEPGDEAEQLSTGVKLDFNRLAGVEIALAHSMSPAQQDGVTYLYFFYVGDGGNSWTRYRKASQKRPSPATFPG